MPFILRVGYCIYKYIGVGLSALLGLTNQGDARAFKAWTGHRTGSTFLCVCSKLETITICRRGWGQNNN